MAGVEGPDGLHVMLWRRGVEGPVKVLCTPESAREAARWFALPPDAGTPALVLVTVVQDGRRSRLTFLRKDLDGIAIEEVATIVQATTWPH